jgi:hypothetical protein
MWLRPKRNVWKRRRLIMSLSPINSNWRGDMQEYFRLVDEGLAELLSDPYEMACLEKLYKNSDIKKSLENSLLKMWRLEKGWEFKKRKAAISKTARINMKRQLYDTVYIHLVDKSSFASQPKETRDAKPVIQEAEERRNIHLQQLAATIGAALAKVQNRTELAEEYFIGFEKALEEKLEDVFLEEFYKKLQAEHPEAFVKVKDREELFQESAQALLADTNRAERSREQARQILSKMGV